MTTRMGLTGQTPIGDDSLHWGTRTFKANLSKADDGTLQSSRMAGSKNYISAFVRNDNSQQNRVESHTFGDYSEKAERYIRRKAPKQTAERLHAQ